MNIKNKYIKSSSTLKMRSQLVPEMAEHFYTLMWLSSQDDFTEYQMFTNVNDYGNKL